MKRRDYIAQAAALGGATGLAGCGLFGGDGEETETEETPFETRTVDVGGDETTAATETTTEPEVSETLQEAIEAKDSALETFTGSVDRARSISVTPAGDQTQDGAITYDFRAAVVQTGADGIDAALEAAEDGDGATALGAVATYLHAVGPALADAEAAAETFAQTVMDVYTAGLVPVGLDIEQSVADIEASVTAARDTLDSAVEQRDAVSTVPGVVSDADVIALEAAHEGLREQLEGMRSYADGLTDYVAGAESYAAGDQHRDAAERAGEQEDGDRLDEALQNAIDDYSTAQTQCEMGHDTVDDAAVQVESVLQTAVTEVRCRVGALEAASVRWQEFAQLVVERADSSEIDQAETEACLALNQCADDAQRACGEAQ